MALNGCFCGCIYFTFHLSSMYRAHMGPLWGHMSTFDVSEEYYSVMWETCLALFHPYTESRFVSTGTWCPCKGFYHCDKDHEESQLGEERVHFSWHLQVTDHHWGNSSQEPVQRPHRNAAYCLVFHGLLSQLSYTIQKYLPGGFPPILYRYLIINTN